MAEGFCNTKPLMEAPLIIPTGDSRVLVQRAEEPYASTITVEAEGSLTLIFLNLTGVDAQTLRHEFTLKDGATLTMITVMLHGNTDHEIISTCAGPDATSSLTAISYARGHEKQKIRMRNIFDAARGGGEMLMKGVAEEQASTVLHGLIDIGLKGNGTNTYLTQDVLMLDPSAKVDAIPGLEIKTNDVKASHSAGVKRITEEDYFTFAARGIEREEARHMFIVGFLTDAIRGLPAEEEVLVALEKKMVNRHSSERRV